ARVARDAERAPEQERALAAFGHLRELRRGDDEDLLERVVEIRLRYARPRQVPEQRSTMRLDESAQPPVLGDGHVGGTPATRSLRKRYMEEYRPPSRKQERDVVDPHIERRICANRELAPVHGFRIETTGDGLPPAELLHVGILDDVHRPRVCEHEVLAEI